MIRAAWRGVVRFLGSAGLALGLLVFVGIWSAVASAIPQADAPAGQVAAWVAAHPGLEPVVGPLGLHQAFTAPVFLVCIALLTLCTALCAWRRTKVAIARSRAFGAAVRADQESVVAKHDLEIECDPALDGSRILSIATDTFEGLGLRTRREGELVRSVSPAWSVWGSPVFHWALVAFVVVVLLGSLRASSGLMGVATGQTVPDVAASYGLLTAGPLRDWSAVHRAFRVDAVDPDLRVGNLDYGPAPTVSVLDGSGHVIKTQLVYPNMPLQVGSVTVHAPAFGLSATLSMVDTAGAEVARTVELIDFSDVATGGTVPVAPIGLWGPSGTTEFIVYVTVPLGSSGGRYVQALPTAPTARVTITTPGGQTVLDRVVKPSDAVPLPTGGALRVVNIGWYARLSIVDDSTVPFFYAVLFVALIGLATAVFARQQYVVATVVQAPDGPRLVLSARLWRNASTTRESMVSALTEALGKGDGAEEGRDS